MPTLFGRAEDEKIRLGRCLSTEGDGLRRRSVVSVVFMRIRALALPRTAEDTISSKVPRGRPHFVYFPKSYIGCNYRERLMPVILWREDNMAVFFGRYPGVEKEAVNNGCLLYTSPSPRD